jgi:hypothetical protein
LLTSINVFTWSKCIQGEKEPDLNNQPTEQINKKNQAQALTVTNPKKWKTLKPNHQDYLRNRRIALKNCFPFHWKPETHSDSAKDSEDGREEEWRGERRRVNAQKLKGWRRRGSVWLLWKEFPAGIKTYNPGMPVQAYNPYTGLI